MAERKGEKWVLLQWNRVCEHLLPENNTENQERQKAQDIHENTYHDPKREEELKQFSQTANTESTEFWNLKEGNACYDTIPSVSHESKLGIHFFTETRSDQKCTTLSEIFFFQNRYQ